jgi:hypothetical protein
MGRAKRSPKTSGFQYIILFSSTEADDIISWKEESPVFSLTHCTPLGEKMENPEDDPEAYQHLGTRKKEDTHTYIPSLSTVIGNQ